MQSQFTVKQKIKFISRARPARNGEDKYIRQYIKDVKKHIAQLRQFANLKPETLASQNTLSHADTLQNELNQSIAQFKTNV